LGRIPVQAYTSGGTAANNLPRPATWASTLNPNPGVAREYPEPGKLFMLARHGELTGEWIHDAGMGVYGTPAYRDGYETSRYLHYTNNQAGYPPIYWPNQFTGTSYANNHWQTNPAHAGSYHDTCRVGFDTTQSNDCWEQPVGEWWTIMCRFRPGHSNVGYVTPVQHFDTLLEIKVARWGATSWTHIYYDDAAPWWWNTTGAFPKGHSTLRLVNYRNDVPYWTSMVQAYTQVILSTQEIPCPQVY
jgi:hypothetical protein